MTRRDVLKGLAALPLVATGAAMLKPKTILVPCGTWTFNHVTLRLENVTWARMAVIDPINVRLYRHA